MTEMSDLIIKLRWVIIVGFMVATASFAAQLRYAEVDPAVKSQLPSDMPSIVITDKIDELFGGTEMVMILIEADDVLNPKTLERTKTISKKMKRVKGIGKVLSLFELKNIKGEEGAMIVDPAVKMIPKTPDQREMLRQEIKENDMVYGSVVAEDFSATAVIGMVDANISDETVVMAARRIVEETPGEENTVIAGLPYVRMQITKGIQTDLRRLMPIALLVMLVFLFACFKQLRGVLLPFFVVIMSIMFSMGLIPVFGWKIHMITVLLPVMLVAIANDYGIHLIARYQEDNAEGAALTKQELARGIFEHLFKPIVLTGITTMAGMLCLLGHVLVPAKQLGIMAGLGIVYALAASLLFIPAMLSIIPISKPILRAGRKSNKPPLLERMLEFFGRLVSSKAKAVVAAAILFSLLGSIGIFFIEVDTNPSSYYSENSPVVYANNMANEKFGGSTNVSVVFKGDIKQPEIMNRIDALENRLRNLPEVGNTISIARAVRQMSRSLNDEDELGYDAIPDTRNAVAQYFEIYSMSGDPDDFEKLIDFPYEHAQVMARIREVSTKKINRVVKYVQEITKGDEDIDLVGGFASILGELAELAVRGQLISLAGAIVIVGLFIMIMFRSVIAGLISSIPLALSISMLFGFMGFFGIELNIATAMLSSIMIGVGVDYTIHFLWRYRKERWDGLDSKEAAKKTLTTTGRGIVFNALSVIVGFAVLLISSFLPVRFFGFLVVVSIGACLIGALILVPSLCIIFRPKFLEPKGAVE
ncbi:MAG: MMPL family transporter [Candidatus Latescibacteria bacterium]|nr:MMPL family transporter [Candidatus Latescibacterota bacterium]NIM22684.1 MMPL family transporter [Candidatus Latescibacterota bacterium]NIM64973.1 MMPL family transporter [Candidatus Latescibacterota bacterium]NIO01488.1 MMPL family transporter [Candidatus Latescibacterota bacterium]NIO27998.1 MMPL family transporter [Candidatus Latescibacterota bacterium]